MDLHIYMDYFCGVKHSLKSSFSDVLQLTQCSGKIWMPQKFNMMGCVQSLENISVYFEQFYHLDVYLVTKLSSKAG